MHSLQSVKPIFALAALTVFFACQRAQPPAFTETIQTGSEQPAAIQSSPASPALTADDIAFVRTALAEGMGEVELATAVRSESRNADVRSLASDVIDDFNRIDAELANIAYAQSLPANDIAPDLVRAKRIIVADRRDVDEHYLDVLVSSYNDLLPRYAAAAQNASDQNLKRIAAQATQALQQHVERALMLRQRLA